MEGALFAPEPAEFFLQLLGLPLRCFKAGGGPVGGATSHTLLSHRICHHVAKLRTSRNEFRPTGHSLYAQGLYVRMVPDRALHHPPDSTVLDAHLIVSNEPQIVPLEVRGEKN